MEGKVAQATNKPKTLNKVKIVGDWQGLRFSIKYRKMEGKVAQAANKPKNLNKVKSWAIGAVGSALERHSRGHKFEPCIAQLLFL